MHWSKIAIMCLGLLVGANQAAAQEEPERFMATLSNGVTVELIGVSYHNPGGGFEPKRWWHPDGTELADAPYRHPRKSTGAGGGYYAREFAIRITGADDYSCATYNSLGRSNVQPVVPLNEKNESVPGVRAFVCRFKDGQAKDTIRIGMSTEPWQRVEEWMDDAWQEHDHDNIVFPKSKNPLILTWPRQKGRAVILEMVRADMGNVQARRMLLLDRHDQIHEESPRTHGEGPGLIKEQYWFWNMRLENMYRIEYQTRPYEWVEFRNVALEPGRQTNVEVVVLDVKDKVRHGLSVNKEDMESLGYILHKLVQNLRFPERGRATYRIEEIQPRIEEIQPRAQALRLLRCEYVFDGILYRFSVEGTRPGDLNVRRYFDGEKTTRYQVQNNVATIWEDRRERTPIYRLQKFFPSDIVDELLTHEVELKGSGHVGAVPCALLESVISSKDKLKVWATKEPDVYPLRIERYEHDNLRYVYEAANIKSWNSVLFPKKTTISWYRSDDTLQHSLISSYVVSVESFTPDVEIAASEFVPKFPSDISVNTQALPGQQASDFEPTQPAKRLRQFSEIDLDFNMDQAKGKRILVCFWDMNQRPSRNCLIELAKGAGELADRDIIVIAVHASTIDHVKLDGWVKTHDVSFPVGRIEGNEKRLRYTWGIDSLPWLILTDRKHIVRAEGFALSELSDRIDGIRDGES